MSVPSYVRATAEAIRKARDAEKGQSMSKSATYPYKVTNYGAPGTDFTQAPEPVDTTNPTPPAPQPSVPPSAPVPDGPLPSPSIQPPPSVPDAPQPATPSAPTPTPAPSAPGVGPGVPSTPAAEYREPLDFEPDPEPDPLAMFAALDEAHRERTKGEPAVYRFTEAEHERAREILAAKDAHVADLKELRDVLSDQVAERRKAAEAATAEAIASWMAQRNAADARRQSLLVAIGALTEQMHVASATVGFANAQLLGLGVDLTSPQPGA